MLSPPRWQILCLIFYQQAGLIPRMVVTSTQYSTVNPIQMMRTTKYTYTVSHHLLYSITPSIIIMGPLPSPMGTNHCPPHPNPLAFRALLYSSHLTMSMFRFHQYNPKMWIKLLLLTPHNCDVRWDQLTAFPALH